jgi:hypothetical protein
MQLVEILEINTPSRDNIFGINGDIKSAGSSSSTWIPYW